MKGFYLTLVGFIFLFFVVVISQISSSVLSNIEKSYSELNDLLNYKYFSLYFSKASIEKQLSQILYYALFKLSNHTAENPVIPKGRDGTKNVEKALLDLFLKGEAKGYFRGRDLIYSEEEKAYSTLTGYIERVNESLKDTPYYIDTFSIKDVKIFLLSYDRVGLNATITVSISHKSGKFYTNYSTPISVNVSIEGLPDPIVNRIAKSLGEKGKRYIYLYKTPPAVGGEGDLPVPITLPTPPVEAGQGWFYGRVVDVSDADSVPSEQRWLTALKGTFDEIQSYPSASDFGAYIVTSGIRWEDIDSDDCLEEITFNGIDLKKDESDNCVPGGILYFEKKPFLVLSSSMASDFDFGNSFIFFNTGVELPESQDSITGEEKYGAIGATFKDIEYIRDLVACQYYFHPPFAAPNFFQRMLSEFWSYSDEEKGLASFLIGYYFGGLRTEEFENYSNIDYQFAMQYINGNEGDFCVSTVYLGGLPGVKTPQMLNSRSVVGKFSLPEEYVDSLSWSELVVGEAGRCS